MPNREQSIPPITADHGEASGSLGQRAKSGAIWITVEMVSIQLVSIVVFAVLARFIGPAQFGLMSISYVLVYSTRWIVFENIATAISRKARPTELEFTTAFWMTLGASLVSFVAFEGLTLVADKVFRTPGLAEILRPMGVILIGMGLSRTQEVWLSRHFRFQSLAIRAAVAAVVGGAVGVGCAMAGLGVWALVAQQMAMALTALACLWLATPWRPTLNFCSDTAKDVVHFVRDTSGASLLNTLNESVDTVMVAAFFGAESVGLYATGKRLKQALYFIAAGPINGVVLPTIAEVQNEPERLRRVLITATSVIFMLACPIFFGVGAVSRDAIILLFGEKWAGAAPVLMWLSISSVFAIAMNYNNNVFVVGNQQIWTLWVSGLSTALSIVLFFFVSHLGSNAITLPFVAPYLVTFPASMYLMMKMTGMDAKEWARAAGPPFLAALIMFGVVYATPLPWGATSPLLSLVCKALMGASIYAIGLWLLAREDIGKMISMTKTWI